MSAQKPSSPPAPPALAVVLDLACLAVFVAFGGRRHEDLNEGMSWYLEVLWPIVLGWFVVALVTRLYTRANGGGMWLALLGTLVGGLVITQLLRGSLQDRPWIGIFTLVAFGFIGLTTFGWRLVGSAYRKLRPAPAA